LGRFAVIAVYIAMLGITAWHNEGQCSYYDSSTITRSTPFAALAQFMMFDRLAAEVMDLIFESITNGSDLRSLALVVSGEHCDLPEFL
jgi:hypothetical protein